MGIQMPATDWLPTVSSPRDYVHWEFIACLLRQHRHVPDGLRQVRRHLAQAAHGWTQHADAADAPYTSQVRLE